MTRKNIFQIAGIVLVVAGFYLYLYRDSFKKRVIQIGHTIRPSITIGRRRTAEAADAGSKVVIFAMGTEYKLTSVKVVPLEQFKTNRFAHPLWELISSSNSVPIRGFSYGEFIRGMHPLAKGGTAEPLTPNVAYRLLVEAGSIKGEHDFTIGDTNAVTP